jgi:hypothetical protein
MRGIIQGKTERGGTGVRQSMSRSRNAVFAGTAPAFACAETFFKTLKPSLKRLTATHRIGSAQFGV